MNRIDALVWVLRVACLTEDRDENEQRAMLDVALALDKERGAFLSTNRALAPPSLVALVETTYEPSVGRAVSLTVQQRSQYARLLADWESCGRCGLPQGAHYGNDDPAANCPRGQDRARLVDAQRRWLVSPPVDLLPVQMQGRLL